MAVRLQMKLGVVAEQDRLPDSPDTVVVVEPSVGSVARSKGHLYLLVTSRATGHRVHEATRLAAETIRNEYYYDESAGIRVCLEKAIEAANKRLGHQRDRLGLGHAADGNGPIGIGVAVVRGNELYVATVGPAEAYLIRQARLSTLPDPHRERGLPTTDLAPDVWRGEISVGDSLVLISGNVMARVGAEELKDAMVTLHPQSAMEHLHHRFIAADGSGSDGAIAFEATEVASTQKQRTLVPVRPAEPLAGAPDRSPIPLADQVVDGVAAVQTRATRAGAAAGNLLERAVMRIQELVLPRRRTAYRRVTPLSARREMQRRAAVALLAFVLVAAGLGIGVYAFAGGQGKEVIPSVTAGERALKQARDDIGEVFAPGVDLTVGDPGKAGRLLTDAYSQLDTAERTGVSSSTIAPLRAQAIAGLDRLYGMKSVVATPIYTFPKSDPAIDLTSLIEGPDGALYTIDRGHKAVYRIDVKAGVAKSIIGEGTKAAGKVAGAPKFITRGGPDLVIVDANNVVWRWRPADSNGRGTLTLIRVNGAAGWGDDIRDVGTYLRQFGTDTGLYNFYVIDPSAKQLLRYPPAADGSGFPAAPTQVFATQRDVASMTSLYIDGDIFVIEAGKIERFVGGKDDGWDAAVPPDALLRSAPVYTRLASGTGSRVGRLYGYDPANARIVAFDKADGHYREEYRVADNPALWGDLRGMFVRAGIENDPDTLIWITKDAVYESVLEGVPEPIPGQSGAPPPSASGSPGSSGALPSGSPVKSPTPTKKP